jgi:hypothetical protein
VHCLEYCLASSTQIERHSTKVWCRVVPIFSDLRSNELRKGHLVPQEVEAHGVPSWGDSNVRRKVGLVELDDSRWPSLNYEVWRAALNGNKGLDVALVISAGELACIGRNCWVGWILDNRCNLRHIHQQQTSNIFSPTENRF